MIVSRKKYLSIFFLQWNEDNPFGPETQIISLSLSSQYAHSEKGGLLPFREVIVSYLVPALHPLIQRNNDIQPAVSSSFLSLFLHLSFALSCLPLVHHGKCPNYLDLSLETFYRYIRPNSVLEFCRRFLVDNSVVQQKKRGKNNGWREGRKDFFACRGSSRIIGPDLIKVK